MDVRQHVVLKDRAGVDFPKPFRVVTPFLAPPRPLAPSSRAPDAHGCGMPIGFAGSRDTSDRWRRHVVQGSERRPPRRIRIDPPHSPPRDDEPETTPVLTMKTGIRSIIPRDAWKIWGIVGLALAGWLGVLSIGILADEFATSFRGLLGLSAGRTTRWMSACCLLAASQLSFLILWHRSLSRKDFWGRFRLWYWAGLVWLAFAVAEGLSLHLHAARWLEERYRLKVWNGTTVCWMLAVCPVAIGLLRLLRREMHLCRQSSLLLRGSAGVAGVSAAVTLAYPLLPQTTTTALFASVALTLWPLLLACSLLIHARFVIHVTNDVLVPRCPRRASRIAGMAWGAGASVLRSAVSLPWTIVNLTPVARLWRRRTSRLIEETTLEESPPIRRRSRKGSAERKEIVEADAPVQRGSMVSRLLGAVRGRLAAWSERRAARALEREARREAAAAERRVASAAKAEARRVAEEERLAKQATEKAEREAAKLRAEEQRRAAAEKAKADRDAAERERAAQRERAEAEAREKSAREKSARAEAERAREAQRAKEAAAREAEKRAQAEKRAEAERRAEAEKLAQAEKARATAAAAAKPQPAASKSVAPAPHIQPSGKVDVPRPKSSFERPAASSAGAIKPQHVSFPDDDDSDEEETRGMSRKERKRMKKMARRGEAMAD